MCSPKSAEDGDGKEEEESEEAVSENAEQSEIGEGEEEQQDHEQDVGDNDDGEEEELKKILSVPRVEIQGTGESEDDGDRSKDESPVYFVEMPEEPPPPPPPSLLSMQEYAQQQHHSHERRRRRRRNSSGLAEVVQRRNAMAFQQQQQQQQQQHQLLLEEEASSDHEDETCHSIGQCSSAMTSSVSSSVTSFVSVVVGPPSSPSPPLPTSPPHTPPSTLGLAITSQKNRRTRKVAIPLLSLRAAAMVRSRRKGTKGIKTDGRRERKVKSWAGGCGFVYAPPPRLSTKSVDFRAALGWVEKRPPVYVAPLSALYLCTVVVGDFLRCLLTFPQAVCLEWPQSLERNLKPTWDEEKRAYF